MTAPTYEEFVALGFTASEQEFGAEVRRAQAMVDRIVGPNEVTEGREEAYRLAVCAACQRLADYGDGHADSVKLGAFSVSGAASGADMAEQDALLYLVPAGLAFGGVA